MTKWLMAAGGTGGHVFPALAIAVEVVSLESTKSPNPILFVGTAKGFENRLVPQNGFSLERISIGGVKGKGLVLRLKNLLLLPLAFWQSWRILRKFSPSVVFGIGGYASGPILLSAALFGFKTAILEPNAIPGFSNRILGRFVHRVFVAFEEAMTRFPRAKCMFSGNPIRKEILAVRPPETSGNQRTILVFGGSQGAQKLNQAVTDALSQLQSHKERIFFIHQTGTKDEKMVRAAYEKAGFKAEVSAFIDTMAEAYRRSDVVVARSGSSVLEVAACGRPSILIPFPHAADDHQRANARVLERAGAAIYIEDHECNGTRLAQAIHHLLEDEGEFRKMSEKALTFRKENAATLIVAEMTRLAGATERKAA